MVTLRTAAGKVVAWLHDGFVQLPQAAQAALIVLAFALYQFALGFGWYVPTDPTNIHLWIGELVNAGTLAWAIALPIITDRLWPAIVPWVLSFFRLEITVPPAKPSLAAANARVLQLWSPVAA